MKILIDIPDSEYNGIKTRAWLDPRSMEYFERKIADGIILSPKTTNGDLLQQLFSLKPIGEDGGIIQARNVDADIMAKTSWWYAKYDMSCQCEQ